MTQMPNAYDQVPYPSMVFGPSHPEALALLARLHGIDAPAVEHARILHVGGGDGLDAIAVAVAFPDADVLNFDLSREALARGRRRAERAGLANMRNELIDILEAADRLDGPYDYIVAHGVYAWVPAAVRDAVMPMVGRLLSPNGVAFVSYNTAPGGHTRCALRDMIMHHVRHIEAPYEKLAAAREMLRGFVIPKENDPPITMAMRKDAQAALAQSDGVFFHDVLNSAYAPQSLFSTCSDAARHGLHYLCEARGGLLEKGFIGNEEADVSEAVLLDRLQAQDYANGRYFRASLLVREGTAFSRRLDPERAKPLWVSSRANSLGPNSFALGEKVARIDDPRRAEMLHRLIAAKPRFMPVADLTQEPDLLGALILYALQSLVQFRTVPPPYAYAADERPVASPLARMQALDGESPLIGLHHEPARIENGAVLRLLGLLDGSRDRNELGRLWLTFPNKDAMTLDQALQILADKALLRA